MMFYRLIVLFHWAGRPVLGREVVGEFDYNTSTAQLGLGLGLSLAIRLESTFTTWWDKTENKAMSVALKL